jgi:hypothetical protein
MAVLSRDLHQPCDLHQPRATPLHYNSGVSISSALDH